MGRCGAVFEMGGTVACTPARVLPVVVEVGIHPVLFAVSGQEEAGGLSAGDYRALAGAVDPRTARDFDELMGRVRGMPAYALQERVLSAVLRDPAEVNQLLSGTTTVDDALELVARRGDIPPAACAGRALLTAIVERPARVRAQLIEGLNASWRRHGETWTNGWRVMQRARNRLEHAGCSALLAQLPFDLRDDELVWRDCCRIPVDRVESIAIMPSVLATGRSWTAFATANDRWQFAITRPVLDPR